MNKPENNLQKYTYPSQRSVTCCRSVGMCNRLSQNAECHKQGRSVTLQLLHVWKLVEPIWVLSQRSHVKS